LLELNPINTALDDNHEDPIGDSIDTRKKDGHHSSVVASAKHEETETTKLSFVAGPDQNNKKSFFGEIDLKEHHDLVD
jgi:hypothetical protein